MSSDPASNRNPTRRAPLNARPAAWLLLAVTVSVVGALGFIVFTSITI